MKKFIVIITILALPCLMLAQEVSSPKAGADGDGSVLPFPEPPSASVAGKTLADSKHKWRRTCNII